jgi:regulator of sirC expression with transglutaminase-like and TPR domain
VTADSRAAFAAGARSDDPNLGQLCALIAVEADPDCDVEATLESLASLANSVDERRPRGDVEALRSVLADFSGDPSDYGDLRSSLLPDVLVRRRGLPILLSVAWLETARLAGVPAYGASLPGHFVVGVGSPDGPHEVVDPFSGGASVDEPDGQPLEAWETLDIVGRVLANVRNWAAQGQDRWRTRLWAVELGLLLPRHPLELRRERGLLLVRGGNFAAGARELEEYADVAELTSPQTAEAVRHEARTARAQLN